MSRKKKKKKGRSAQTTSDLSVIREFALQQYIDNRGEGLNTIASAIFKKFHFSITRGKLKSWRDEGGWKDILGKERDQAKAVDPDGGNFKSVMIEALRDRKDAYERYFKTLDEDRMDNNAHWAYKDILTKLDSLIEERERQRDKDNPVSKQQKIKNAMEVYGADY